MSFASKYFSSLEEIEKEFRETGPPFRLPDLSKALDGNPLVGHIPHLEISEKLKEATGPVHELIEKYNPRPWPYKIYISRKREIEVEKLPHTVNELSVIEKMPLGQGARSSSYYTTTKVAKVVVEK